MTSPADETANPPSPDSVEWRAEPERIQAGRVATQGGADPVMVRAYSGPHKGATAFFRNRPLLEVAVGHLAAAGRAQGRCRVLFHACSVGAEPYSLAFWWQRQFPAGAPVPLEIFATDIAPRFIEIARRAVYPVGILAGMTEREKAWFEPHAGEVRVPEAIRGMVNFLPAMSFVDGEPGGEFDAVFVMNALTYVRPPEQTEAVRRISGYTRHLLGLTAFHPDTIRADVTAAGFRPLADRRPEIHRAWGDRLSAQPVPPGTPEYSWRLPPYAEAAPDWEYRMNSLFVREADRSPGR